MCNWLVPEKVSKDDAGEDGSHCSAGWFISVFEKLKVELSWLWSNKRYRLELDVGELNYNGS